MQVHTTCLLYFFSAEYNNSMQAEAPIGHHLAGGCFFALKHTLDVVKTLYK